MLGCMKQYSNLSDIELSNQLANAVKLSMVMTPYKKKLISQAKDKRKIEQYTKLTQEKTK